LNPRLLVSRYSLVVSYTHTLPHTTQILQLPWVGHHTTFTTFRRVVGLNTDCYGSTVGFTDTVRCLVTVTQFPYTHHTLHTRFPHRYRNYHTTVLVPSPHPTGSHTVGSFSYVLIWQTLVPDPHDLLPLLFGPLPGCYGWLGAVELGGWALLRFATYLVLPFGLTLYGSGFDYLDGPTPFTPHVYHLTVPTYVVG